MPLWSLGLLAWGPVAWRAVRARRLRDGVFAAVYLALSATQMTLSVRGGGGSPGTSVAQQHEALAGGFIGLALMFVGTLHAAVLWWRPAWRARRARAAWRGSGVGAGRGIRPGRSSDGSPGRGR